MIAAVPPLVDQFPSAVQVPLAPFCSVGVEALRFAERLNESCTVAGFSEVMVKNTLPAPLPVLNKLTLRPLAMAAGRAPSVIVLLNVALPPERPP